MRTQTPKGLAVMDVGTWIALATLVIGVVGALVTFAMSQERTKNKVSELASDLNKTDAALAHEAQIREKKDSDIVKDIKRINRRISDLETWRAVHDGGRRRHEQKPHDSDDENETENGE